MGKPLPPEYPEVEDLLWYITEMQAYQGPLGNCGDPFVGAPRCCQQGDFIKNWQSFDLECLAPWELCPWSGFTAQRLHNIKGPYNTRNECLAAL